MKKTLKRSMSIFLSVLMVFSVLSSGMFSASALTQVVISNCDSADGWVCYPGDGLELTTSKKTEGTGSIHTSQSGGFVQGTALPNLNLTGIQSITFDFAANTEEALSAPADVELYLFSGSGYQGFQELGEVDTTQALIFDSDAIRAGYGRDDMSFATITAGVKTVGESFNPSNVTGLLFWG